MLKSDIIIVIPIYREELAETEKISLEQVQKVLHEYQICYMAPKRLKDYIRKKGYKAEFFPDKCMESRFSYGRCLETPDFYLRFKKYKYMLLYQLDAFVFYDRLLEFAEMGYDYIGAPIPRTWWYDVPQMVGGGGLTLRSIESCIRVTNRREEICEKSGMRDRFDAGGEDVFFAYCGGIKEYNFSVPSVSVAKKFALEYNVGHVIEKMGEDTLPLGCHGWSKNVYFKFWEQYIASRYSAERIRKVKREIYINGEKDYISDYYKPRVYRYLITRILRKKDNIKLKKIISEILNDSSCVVWGIGIVGRLCVDLLENAMITIDFIVDRNKANLQNNKYTIKDTKDIEQIKKPIIVATTTHYQEIKNELEQQGMRENINFFSWLHIQNIVVNRYYT